MKSFTLRVFVRYHCFFTLWNKSTKNLSLACQQKANKVDTRSAFFTTLDRKDFVFYPSCVSALLTGTQCVQHTTQTQASYILKVIWSQININLCEIFSAMNQQDKGGRHACYINLDEVVLPKPGRFGHHCCRAKYLMEAIWAVSKWCINALCALLLMLFGLFVADILT